MKRRDIEKNIRLEFNKIRRLNRAKEDYRKVREEVIAAYGGKCVCCGENRYEFLTIDHINGKGKLTTRGKGYPEYYALRKRNYPKQYYRVLCMNCNWAIGRLGVCPHEIEREEEIK